MKTIEIQEGTNGTMYFVGNREIAKPQLIKDPIGDYIAVSVSGLGGVRHFFKADEIKHIQEMETIDTPEWASLAAGQKT
ncbi:hypothetical protein [Shewanella sp. Iso12]|uniref:hypothetical protein n=1 Tax=Shewanella sp. Iso12 TaxID=1826753 RepID=UPI00142FE1C5|nr:hypothetical protein [Shewanella sp. Iso12]NJI86912.1 hypothetical protein [Shewanella sp. Iso12]